MNLLRNGRRWKAYENLEGRVGDTWLAASRNREQIRFRYRGTTLYQVLDDVEEGPEFSAVIHELAEKYPGTVDYEFEAKADVFNLLDVNNNVIATISEQEMIDTLNLLGERSAKEGEEQ